MLRAQFEGALYFASVYAACVVYSKGANYSRKYGTYYNTECTAMLLYSIAYIAHMSSFQSHTYIQSLVSMFVLHSLGPTAVQ